MVDEPISGAGEFKRSENGNSKEPVEEALETVGASAPAGDDLSVTEPKT